MFYIPTWGCYHAFLGTVVFIVRSSYLGSGGFVDKFADTLDGGRGKIE